MHGYFLQSQMKSPGSSPQMDELDIALLLEIKAFFGVLY